MWRARVSRRPLSHRLFFPAVLLAVFLASRRMVRTTTRTRADMPSAPNTAFLLCFRYTGCVNLSFLPVRRTVLRQTAQGIADDMHHPAVQPPSRVPPPGVVRH